MSRMIPDDATIDEAITILKALADPNRLSIFAELMRGDSSHHLRTLSEAGLVTSRRDNIDGRWIYYSVDRQAVARWQAWFSEFLDPQRIQDRVVCGPEGNMVGGVNPAGQLNVLTSSGESRR
jgi:DNA-binding transcriptional ArsR family regulator